MRDKSYWNWVKRTQEEGKEPFEANMDQLNNESIYTPAPSSEVEEIKLILYSIFEDDKYRSILSEKEADAFELTYIHGMELMQAAEVLKIHHSSLQERLESVKDKVRSYIELHPRESGGSGV